MLESVKVYGHGVIEKNINMHTQKFFYTLNGVEIPSSEYYRLRTIQFGKNK